MEQAVSKLLAMFEAGVSQLGTQATRLYPEVVKLYMWEQIFALIFSGLAFLIVMSAMIFFIRKASSYEKRSALDDGAEGWGIGAILTGIASIGMLVVSCVNAYHAARVMVAPEAAFVLDHINKLMGGR